MTVLFPAICFTGGGPAELWWTHEHEGGTGSLRCRATGVAEFRPNGRPPPMMLAGVMLICLGLHKKKRQRSCTPSVRLSIIWLPLGPVTHKKTKQWCSFLLSVGSPDLWIRAISSACLFLIIKLSICENFPLKIHIDSLRGYAASAFGDVTNGWNGGSFSVWVCYPNNGGMLWEQRALITQPFMRRPYKSLNHSFSRSLLSQAGNVSSP